MARPLPASPPRPGAAPRLPASVLRRRPAQVRPLPAAVPRPRGRRPAPPRPGPGRSGLPVGVIAAVLVFCGLFTVGLGLGVTTGVDLRGLFREPDRPPPRAFPVLGPSRPVRLAVPAIRVDAPVLDVGLARDGSVDVPPLARHNEVGWFSGGPTPGQFGPALLVGHADTRTGPSVFAALHRLRPGQRLEVTRRDHRVAVFEVNSVERFAKTALPAARVYGDFSRPVLRLVTCGGTWLGGGRGYRDNVVVFASLVAVRRT